MRRYLPFNRLASLILITSAALVAPTAHAQSSYTLTEITLPTGATLSGINDKGQVLGFVYTGTDTPFVYDINAQAYTVIPQVGYSYYEPLAIDNGGDVVFSWPGGTFNGAQAAYIYNLVSAGFSSFVLPPSNLGTLCTFAVTEVNNGGLFGGFYTNYMCGAEQAYIYNSVTKTFTYLTGPNNSYTSATVVGLNDQSIVLLSGSFGFALANLAANTYTPLPAPGSYSGLNNAGQTVGILSAGSKGFVYDTTAKTYTYFNAPSGSSIHPIAINNNNVIVGTYLVSANGASVTHYFIAAPGSSSQNPKTLGSPCDNPGGCSAGNPISVGTGNKFEEVTDYETAGQNKISFARYYNSGANISNPGTYAKTLGINWRSTYDRYLQITSAGGQATSVGAERADGRVLTFTVSSSVWSSDSDVDIKLTQSGSTWTLTDIDDSVETYTANPANANEALLTSIRARNGYTQILNYNANNQLVSVTDSYNRSLSFSYNSGGLLSTVTTPDSLVLTYDYTGGVLTSVSYSTTPQTSRTYLYENAALPYLLTGITDEDGNRFATWTYDTQGRGLTSQHGAGVDLTTISYDDTTGNRTVTNALGQQETYKFTTLQGAPKVTEIDRLATSTTAAATQTFTYDTNGYLASSTDWNGNLTSYVNDIHGQPTTIVEASGTSQSRTTPTTYHPTFHLPVTIVTPGLTTAFTYDASGELLTKTLTDTTTTSAPYTTNATTRTWTNTWSNFLLASTKGPRTDVSELTSFTYDASGALTSSTNALSQITKITSHTGGGLPLTVVDPNGVTTTLTYDARQRLLSSTLSTKAGPLTTTLTYDAAGNLQRTSLPDGSALSNHYDSAHRLTATADLLANAINYTLDAAGDRTNTAIFNPVGTTTRQHSANFDALSRVLQDIGGVGQTTAYTYDANGNALTVTDPLTNATEQTFDPLNRVIKITNPVSGNTTISYDTHDRPLTVTDPNGNTTSYTYDGFGDVIQEVSPARGTTVYHYDLDGNLVQKVDARSATANYSYDALSRITATTYPANTAENVTYTYDQAAGGFGIGRLTSVTDASGSLTRTYDERGNILTESRVHGAATLLTTYTYDAASHVAFITYPSNWTVGYTRDAMGRTTALTTKAPGASTTATTLISGITYQPFGPANTLTFGNGVAQSGSFDADYRITNLTATGASPVQKLGYAYDAADNVLSITDGVTSANTQNLGYDTLNRLSSATGGYASLGYSYDANGNRLTENPTSAAAPSLDGLGNLSALTYNQSGRLATVSAGTQQLTQYGYDAFGHRTVKVGSVTATTLYQYDPAGHLLEENDGAGTSRVDYIYLGDQPIATIQPSTNKIYFLHDDRLGTPQLATDASQTVQWTANYQPFGYTNTGIGNIVQNLRLPGQELDIEPGFYQNGFRDYVPGLGRYLESDPIGLAAARNTYGYAALNPLVNTDPNGLLVVHIWNYLGSIGPNRAFGHASITLDDDTYISWWPSKPRSPLIPGTPLYSAPPFLEGYEKDVLWEEGGPNANIRISGLDEAAIEKWWNEFKGNHQWGTLSQNCSTTAVQALAAGGADFYSVLGGGVPSFYNLVWTPSDVSSYANSVNTGISNWNWLKTISQ